MLLTAGMATGSPRMGVTVLDTSNPLSNGADSRGTINRDQQSCSIQLAQLPSLKA